MTVGEAIGITLEEEPKIVNSQSHELNMVFNFDAIRVNRGEFYSEKKWTLPQLKAIYDRHATALSKTDWDTVFLSNHDNPRLVSNFGDTSTAEFRVRSAKLIETMLMTLKGNAVHLPGRRTGDDELSLHEARPVRRYRGKERVQGEGARRKDDGVGVYRRVQKIWTGQFADADAVERCAEWRLYNGDCETRGWR